MIRAPGQLLRWCMPWLVGLNLYGSCHAQPPTIVELDNQEHAEPDPAGRIGLRTSNPLKHLDLNGLSAFRDRPLFAPARRPVAVQPVYAPPQPVVQINPIPNLRLVGVVYGAAWAVAIVRRPGGASLSLKVGDAVDAWRVQEIASDRIVLQEGTREQVFRLFAKEGSTSPQRTRPLTTGLPTSGMRDPP